MKLKIELFGIDVKKDIVNNTLTIPDNVLSIGKSAIVGVSELHYIQFNDTLKTIRTGAFASCGLKRVEIPDSVTTISESTFCDNKNLEYVKLPNKLKTLNCIFVSCLSLNNLVIPESVKYIESFCFNKCENLTSLKILNKNINLSDRAFINTRFEHVYNVISKNTPYDNRVEINKNFIKFLDDINENILNIYKYIDNGYFEFDELIPFLKDREGFEGLTKGVNYGL